MSKNFAVIGVAGFIAPRHLKAIRDTGNRIIAAVDPNDSVGIIDSFSYDISFFKEFERFDRHCEMLRRKPKKERIDYVTICSPNFLHDAHVRFALRNDAHAICEKPLVLNPWNLDALKELEEESGKRLFTILQLRVHPSIIALKKKLAKKKPKKKHEICLTYITSRGLWYKYSWKGNGEQSGGLATNIGVHFYDMLIWLFGKVEHNEVHVRDDNRVSGFLELENARVKWFLSIDKNELPPQATKQKKTTYRSITIDGKEIEFSGGFTDLHTEVYKSILKGKGFGIDDVRPSITLVHEIRNARQTGIHPNSHPFLQKK